MGALWFVRGFGRFGRNGVEAVVSGGVFKIFSSACALLIIKMIILAGATGGMRGKQKSWVDLRALESTWFLETFWRQRMDSLTEC
jgi:hypothetical protein